MNNVDLQKIADELEFDLDDVKMLIDVFTESTIKSMKTLKIAIDNNDFDNIFKSAHAISGSSANLTLMDISDLAKSIETESRKSQKINYHNIYNKLNLLIQKIKQNE
jgi:HPt (histidine-containing phosphotransfer) domain-containing protein